MDLLIITHLLIGVIGVFVGVRLMTGKGRDHENTQEEENIHERWPTSILCVVQLISGLQRPR
jgi:hypothetical protein